MASNIKITIRVSAMSRSQDVQWKCVGSFGALNISQVEGVAHGQTLVTAATADDYVRAILAQVAPLV
jgi:hypothetical protein